MATTTTNFGWDIPQSTDLVKDGATAIAALGQDIDTAFVDLKGGTSGQVLAKNSNTDLDFAWVAQDDSNAIQNAIVDAKGDLIAATAADTPARLAVGANDTVLTADSSTATGLKWAAPAAGGMTLLSTTSLSGSSTSITSINQTYTDLQIYVRDFYMSAGGEMNIQFNTNTGSNYMVNAMRQGGDSYQGTQANFPIGGYDVATSDNNNFASLRIIDYANTVTVKTVSGIGAVVRPSSARGMTLLTGTFFGSTSGISSVQLLASSGTFSAGTVLIYGVK
jgi:hypothetical protein